MYKQRPQHQHCRHPRRSDFSFTKTLRLYQPPLQMQASRTVVMWMMSGDAQHTAAGNMKQPPLPIMTQWVKTAWDLIDPAIIIRAFKKYSITNKLDVTEDDILWQDNRDAPCSDIEGDEMYKDMMTTEKSIQIFEEEDSDKFLCVDSTVLYLNCINNILLLL